MAADQRHRSWQGRTMKQDFIRARSSEQKSQRMADIKRATAQLYRDFPYHEITLTTIAERLGWSRASLYKYVTTKEEIFLELSADARNAYFEDLLSAFPPTLTSMLLQLQQAGLKSQKQIKIGLYTAIS